LPIGVRRRPRGTAPAPAMDVILVARIQIAPEVTVNPGGGSGWDEPPLDIQIPDDARELDRDVLAYQRELRAKRRRNRLRQLTGPFAARGSVMPLLASILAVCLVAGAMLSVATFSPATAPREQTPRPATAAAGPAPPRSSAPAATPAATRPSPARPSPARPSSARPSSARPSPSRPSASPPRPGRAGSGSTGTPRQLRAG
jgi:hypothetical protein